MQEPRSAGYERVRLKESEVVRERVTKGLDFSSFLIKQSCRPVGKAHDALCTIDVEGREERE